MHKLRLRQIAMVVAVAALGAAGCGGSDGSQNKPASATSGLTPSTGSTAGPTDRGTGFVAQVKAVCRQASAAASSADGDASKLAAVLDRYLPVFRAISAPASLQPTYAQLLANLSKISAALKRNDIATVKQLENRDHPLASRLGIHHCAA